MEGDWSHKRGGQFNGGGMVTEAVTNGHVTEVVTNVGRMVILRRWSV